MFLISGETSASLNLDGVPSEKERLARVGMSSEKTEEQDFISEVGIKSSREDLLEEERRSLDSSSYIYIYIYIYIYSVFKLKKNLEDLQ